MSERVVDWRVQTARAVASLGGIGFSPLAPGTVASVATAVVGVLLFRLGSVALPEAVLLVTGVGLFAIERSGAATLDPGWIVIDEMAGQLLAMATLSRMSWRGVVLALVLFRVLDIWKLGPIGWIDRKRNAAGVMGDDLAAGAVAAAMIWAVELRFPGWL